MKNLLLFLVILISIFPVHANSSDNSLNSKPELLTDVLNTKDTEILPSDFYYENKVHYASNRIQVNNEELPILDSLALVLKKYPDLKIELESHTDSKGSDKYNLTLSMKRAQVAASYLVGKGIAQGRIKKIAKGETALENDCNESIFCNETAHKLNRRTIIRLKK